MKVEPTDLKLRRYKTNWLRHVTGMNSSRMAKLVLNYWSNGRRRLGRPLKGLLEESETGLSRSNWWRGGDDKDDDDDDDDNNDGDEDHSVMPVYPTCVFLKWNSSFLQSLLHFYRKQGSYPSPQKPATQCVKSGKSNSQI